MDPLPSYKKPPINEVVCGVRFNASDRLYIPHIGLLWNKFRGDYPHLQHVPPLAARTGQLLIDLATGVPIPRVWFINEADDELIQFQSDGFYLNWRRRERDYPRYEYIIENFEKVVNIIEGFYEEYKLGSIEPIEYELTYINHIPKGQGWESIEDLPRVFSNLNWAQIEGQFLPRPDGTAWDVVFLLPDGKGRLIVSQKHGVRKEDQVPVLFLELKVLGIDNSVKKSGIRDWFDISHEWIVRGFADITTPEIHELWEREK
ncbi:MAG: TIGR04255 family protein [Desulfobacterales bacterium]